MNEEKIEGIVLKVLPFKENDRILSLFTSNLGMMSLYVRGLSEKKPFLINLTTPLCRAEFFFRKGRSDLHHFIDGTILDLHLSMRRSFSHLKYAGKMLQAILKTQMPGKDASKLYYLLISYLKKLPDTPHPETLWISFALKLLKHEGLLALENLCLLCGKKKASNISNGESRCKKCSNPINFFFSERDWKHLRLLTHIRIFDPLLNLKLSSSLIRDIEFLFISQFH